MGRTTTATYDALDDLKTTVDPSGVTSTRTYDTKGNLATSSRPLLNASGSTIATQSTTYAYTGSPGDVTALTDPDGKKWQYTYDSYGDLTKTTAPATAENANGNAVVYGYNTATGWRTSMISPKGNVTGGTPAAFTTTYAYDQVGRLTTTKDPLWTSGAPTKHETVSHYDANGNRDYSIDADGNKTTYAYDPANELLSTARADSTTTSQSYWADGTVKQQIDGRSEATSYAYDPAGALTSVTDPDNNATLYTYDGAGNLIQKQTPDSATTTYTYDGANENTAVDYSDSTHDVTNITYNADGQRTAMTDATGTTMWKWDSLGRLTSDTDGSGVNVSYGYDLKDQMTSIVYPGAHTVTRDYDPAGRIDYVLDWNSNKTTFAYDTNSNLVTETLPTTAGVIDTNTYDKNDALLTATDKKSATTLAGFTYTRDGAEQLATSTTTGISEPAQTYGYTALQQLAKSGTTASPNAYKYDPSDDITQRSNTSSIAYDPAGEACWQTTSAVTTGTCSTVPSGATAYTDNVRGNRTKTTPATGNASTYAYDLADRLTGYTSGSTTASYKYNGTGLRTGKTVGATNTHIRPRELSRRPDSQQRRRRDLSAPRSARQHPPAHHQYWNNRRHLYLRSVRHTDPHRHEHNPASIQRTIRRYRNRPHLPACPLLRPCQRTVHYPGSARNTHSPPLQLCKR